MRAKNCIATAIATVAVSLGGTVSAQEVNDDPLTQNWAPSEWGADDTAGSVNRTTPQMILEAIKLVKQGKVATLGKLYQQDIPVFGSRGWRMMIPGLPTGGPFLAEQLFFEFLR